jgi:hypothetical protein
LQGCGFKDEKAKSDKSAAKSSPDTFLRGSTRQKPHQAALHSSLENADVRYLTKVMNELPSDSFYHRLPDKPQKALFKKGGIYDTESPKGEMLFFKGGIFGQWHETKDKDGNLGVLFKDDKGQEYTSTEQYQMAWKARLMGDDVSLQKILDSRNSEEQKKLGRGVAKAPNPGMWNSELWKKHQRNIIYRGNMFKFGQNPDLKAKLLATGDRIIAEVNEHDCIWGIGLTSIDPRIFDIKKWRGTNWLGETLMAVRDTLRGKTPPDMTPKTAVDTRIGVLNLPEVQPPTKQEWELQQLQHMK